MNDTVLENEALRLRFAADTGRLCELVARDTGWSVLDRPELGLSFRLMVPLPGRRNNPVYGEDQKASSIACRMARAWFWSGTAWIRSSVAGSTFA